MKTISRSSKRQIAELKERLTQCRAFTLGNFFHGADIDPKYAWQRLESSLDARLRDKEDGTYVIHVHDNCWYELSAGATTP